MSLGSFFSNLFKSQRNKPKVPKVLAKKSKSILFNKYFSLVYFLIGWHAFGYLIIKLAQNKAEREGKLSIHACITNSFWF